MSENAKTKLEGKELLTRLTGIPTPVGRIDLDPPSEERNRARQVLAHLAQQRALWDPYDVAIGSFVTQSILDLRERLNDELVSLSTNSVRQTDVNA